MIRTKCSKVGLVAMLGAVLLGALAGCIGYVDGPRHGTVYADYPPEYVYYPGYQVYYSSRTRQYVYQDGRSWVTRPAPRRVSADVLFASPSVGLDFHDSPAIHHATVVRQYPKQWTPQGSRDDGKENNRGDHR